MRILIVNYRYFLSGGPEKYMFNIMKELERHGHEVIPFSVDSAKNKKTVYSKYFVSSIGNRNAVYYDEVKKSPKAIWQLLERSIYSPEVKKAIKKEIRDVKPDIVYIIHFVNKLSPSVIVGAKEMHVPVVLRISDYFMLCPRFDFLYNKKPCEECLTHGYKSCIRKKCVKNSKIASTIRVLSMKIHSMMHIYNNVDAFVTPSQFLRKKLINNGYNANKIFCIPTFTNESLFDNERTVGSYGLYFGRISEEKGVETVVKAYEKMPNRRVIIMGDDTTDEGRKLKAYVAQKELKNINFVGFKTGKEQADIIINSRFVMIPSIWYDNLPNTALESFNYSKPVIASNIGSLPELVVNGYNGFLFEPEDSEDLCNKIELLDDDNLVKKMGNNSKQLLGSKFSVNEHYDSLINLFEQVIQSNG